MDLSLTESPARNCCHLPRGRSGAADETFRGVSFRRRPTGSHIIWSKFIKLKDIERLRYYSHGYGVLAIRYLTCSTSWLVWSLLGRGAGSVFRIARSALSSGPWVEGLPARSASEECGEWVSGRSPFPWSMQYLPLASSLLWVLLFDWCSVINNLIEPLFLFSDSNDLYMIVK